MSILESIKSEKKMSFSHWRYRLLHWAFNVRNPDPINLGFNKLPLFLYTHYCPLFHLTNLIAFLSPLIILLRLIILLGKGVAAVVSVLPLDKIMDLIPTRDNGLLSPPTIKNEKKKFIKFLSNGCYNSFEHFWMCRSNEFGVLKEDTAKAMYDKCMPKIIEAKERAEVRKKKYRERIIFWTNFSRVFIKWAMNLMYVALVGVLLWIGYRFSGTIWGGICYFGEFIKWLFTDAVSLGAFVLFCKLTFWAGLALGISFVLFQTKAFRIFTGAVWSGIGYLVIPFYIVFVPFQWIKSGWKNLCEFVAMFYEENCPPVEIVSDEEAIVESIAEGDNT